VGLRVRQPAETVDRGQLLRLWPIVIITLFQGVKMVSKSCTGIWRILVLISLIGILFLCVSGAVVSPGVSAQEGRPTQAMSTTRIPIAQGALQQINKHFSTQAITYSDGTTLERAIINGPPTPPPGYELERASVALPESVQEMAIKTLTVPAYNWVFGCSAVSGAMIAGYYDRNGFANMYTGPTDGGVMPLNNSSWPTWSDGYNTYPNLPLAASHQGVDGRTTRGSIDDYWVQYNSSDLDPYITNVWTQHAWGDAIGDYMKTSQSAYGNVDGETTFYYYPSSATPINCSSLPADDGTYGRKLFYEARGYTVTACYLQQTDNKITGGFSFAQYKAEIDAGRPVMLNLEGHTIVGVGYDDSTNTVYLHDTWDYLNHTMTWGGKYSGMTLWSVSIVNLQGLRPSVTTGRATNVAKNSATLNGTVNPNGIATTYYFQWGLTSAYGNTTSTQSAGSGVSNVAVSADLTGLTPKTTYHYRLVATNSFGTSYGVDMTFRKSNALPFLMLLLD
jgi:hypothetical protein